MFISIYEPLLLYSVMLYVVIACVNLATYMDCYIYVVSK